LKAADVDKLTAIAAIDTYYASPTAKQRAILEVPGDCIRSTYSAGKPPGDWASPYTPLGELTALY